MPQSSCSVRRLGAGRGAFTYNPSPMHCNSLHRRTPTEQVACCMVSLAHSNLHCHESKKGSPKWPAEASGLQAGI
eukprot:scaffold56422_cov18-Tisochrysis_lutea.AAC.1